MPASMRAFFNRIKKVPCWGCEYPLDFKKVLQATFHKVKKNPAMQNPFLLSSYDQQAYSPTIFFIFSTAKSIPSAVICSHGPWKA